MDLVVGRNIRLARLSRGLTQQKLGEQVGVTYQQIQKYEEGVNRVSAGRLHAIAQVLDYDLIRFFSEDDEAFDVTPTTIPFRGNRRVSEVGRT